MKKRCIRIISIILATVMLIESTPAYAIGGWLETFSDMLAEKNSISYSNQEGEESYENYEIVGEMEELRGEDSKHFRLENGTFLAVDYNVPVHFADEDGTWEDIDNSFELKENSAFAAYADGATSRSSYVIDNGSVSKSFAASLNQGYLFYEAFEDTSVSMSLAKNVVKTSPIAVEDNMAATSDNVENAGESIVDPNQADENDGGQTSPENFITFDIYNEDVEANIINEIALLSEEDEDTSHEAVTELDNLNSGLIYNDVYPGVDFQYENHSYNIKESIIINQSQDDYYYSFVLNLENLVPIVQEDQSIILTRKTDGTEVFKIESPYMEDNAGDTSTDIIYSLSDLGDDTYLLEVTASTDWINAEGRQYPVIIDPSIVVSVGTADGDITSTYVAEGAPTTSHGGASTLYVGYGSAETAKQQEIYLHVNSLPSIPENCVLIGSKLAYYCLGNSNGYTYTASSVKSINLEAHELTPTTVPSDYKSWIQGLKWNTKPSYDSTVVDYATLSDDSEGSYVIWDITSSVQKWYTDSSSNKGLAIIPESNNYSATKAAVAALKDLTVQLHRSFSRITATQ